jgi:hypothetical protein
LFALKEKSYVKLLSDNVQLFLTLENEHAFRYWFFLVNTNVHFVKLGSSYVTGVETTARGDQPNSWNSVPIAN